MHTALMLSSVLLVTLGGGVALGILPRLHGWPRRRDVQLWILGIPLLAFGLAIGALHHFSNRDCFLRAPGWDYLVGIMVPMGMSVAALGSLGLGALRLWLLPQVVAKPGPQVNQRVQHLTERQAHSLGIACPRIALRILNQPLAVTYGIWQPTVLLSTWMIDHLDEHELEVVLAHELGHVLRRDYLIIWLASLLRDAFFYLPTSWRAFRQLQREKELACDDWAIRLTKRPLALASALAKVWQQTANEPTWDIAQSFGGLDEFMEIRIHRLLNRPELVPKPQLRHAVWSYMSAMLVILVVQAINLTIMLAPMGCGPLALLGRM